MHTIGLRSALACAAVGLGVLALPQGAAAQRAYVPDEVVVGIEGEAPRVHRLAPGTTVGEAIAALERDPTVEFAQPNWIARASLAPLDRGTPGTPGGWAADQWSFLGKPGGIRVGRAWDRLIAAGAPGGAGTIVAVVDTGDRSRRIGRRLSALARLRPGTVRARHRHRRRRLGRGRRERPRHPCRRHDRRAGDPRPAGRRQRLPHRNRLRRPPDAGPRPRSHRRRERDGRRRGDPVGGPQRRRRDQRLAAVRCGGDRLRAGADRVRGNPRGEAARGVRGGGSRATR